ncbi:MAG TPA: DUF6230 family protein [Candidatus Dormibacteraeota bacterium]|jgi:hypothetical protein|nr:DUF6230 family protein [Candidatus Dormibacteraeota bacterium]
MAETESSVPLGRTRWRRFAAVLAPAYLALAALVFLAWSGVLAVSFAISGTAFTVTADNLTSTGTDGNGLGFYQLGVVDFTGAGTPVPQVESIIPSASLTNLCQSVSVGPLTLRITAGDAGTPVTASNLVVDATSLSAGSAQFSNINIGQDMGQFSNPALTAPTGRGSGPNVNTGPVPAGTFGQTATAVTINSLRQVANGTSASSFTLPHLSLGFGSAC